MSKTPEYVRVINGRIVPQSTWKARLALCALVLSALAVAGLLASPDASADSGSYLQRLVNAGYDGPVDVWMRIGYAICNAQSGGVSNYSIAQTIVANTGAGIYTAEAYEIIAITNQELCTGNGGRYLV